MNIQQMMDDSKQYAETLEKSKGDWHAQLEHLKRIVEQVNGWQEQIEKAFGAPARRSLFEFTEPTLQLAFTGVMIQQQLETKPSEEVVEVFYRADLHVDENYVLSAMLPQIANHDPTYTLYEIHVSIPRAELIRESLYLINEKLRIKSN